VRVVVVANIVMSLDNVIAVAAAAGGHWTLMIVGLAISIPIVVFGATLLVKLMERWPVIITIGAALIGYVAGEMAWEDKAMEAFTNPYPVAMKYAAALVGAVIVVVWGQWLARRAGARAGEGKVSESNPAR
jgi:predicted tellurium resistance membrane protein TerC